MFVNPALNLDLLSIGIAIAASLILGSIIFFSDRKSVTNFLFLVIAVVTSIWTGFNYLAYQFVDPIVALWIVRLVMFFAALQAYSFFLLIVTFPNRSIQLKKPIFITLNLLVSLVLVLTLSPLVFPRVDMVPGSVPKPVPAPGILFFAAVAVSLVISGIVVLVRRVFKTSGKERVQQLVLLVGVFIMFGSIIFFNFILVAFFRNSSFIPLSGIFTLPFVICTFYAISRHELLNIRIVGTEILVFVVVIITLMEVIVSVGVVEIVFRTGVFITLLIFSILLIRSIVKEVEQRRKLQELTQRLKDLDKVKNEFISVAAHELRAPLTVVKGYISMILDGDTGKVPEQTQGFLEDSLVSNERMIRLVNNMLDVSRIEEERIIYQEDYANLRDVAQTAFGEFSLEAKRKSIELKTEIPENVVDGIYVDKDRLHEVVVNFLSNALKYTEKGGVTLRLSNPKAEMVRLEVADTGIGISEEEQKKLFRKFYRVKTDVGKTIGSGLGLYISKLLIEKFGGKIGVDSKVGEGSTFWFELPVKVASKGTT